jgi:hypothetical protein
MVSERIGQSSSGAREEDLAQLVPNTHVVFSIPVVFSIATTATIIPYRKDLYPEPLFNHRYASLAGRSSRRPRGENNRIAIHTTPWLSSFVESQFMPTVLMNQQTSSHGVSVQFGSRRHLHSFMSSHHHMQYGSGVGSGTVISPLTRE